MGFKVGIISTKKWNSHETLFKSYCGIVNELKKFIPNVIPLVIDNYSECLPEDIKGTIKSLDIIIFDPNCFDNKEFQDCITNAKWIHSFTTGVDNVVRKFSKDTPTFAFTRNGELFDMQMVEYIIGQIISRERHFELYKQRQSENLWKIEDFRMVNQLTVGIIGYGNIGKKLADFLLIFNAKVIALTRKKPGDDDCDEIQFNGVRLTNDLMKVLSSCDYIISILPHTTETDGFFDDQVLRHCKDKRPCFINVGRGNVITTASLEEALDNEWLSHAVLDVFQEEPLPENNPLWTHPRVTITPHTSGRMIDFVEYVAKFKANYELFCAGKPLKYVVDWKKGY